LAGLIREEDLIKDLITITAYERLVLALIPFLKRLDHLSLIVGLLGQTNVAVQALHMVLCA
jgi:hypothetical protein